MDFEIFWAEMLPIKFAIKRRFTMPLHVTCASALPVLIAYFLSNIFA